MITLYIYCHVLSPILEELFVSHSFALNCCLSKTHMHTHIHAHTPGGKAVVADGVMCVLGGGPHVRL